MRETVLYIAMSLDGYIADSEGKVDWLEGQGDGTDVDSYGEFVKNVDTVIMGWNTYEQIMTELSPDQWVYEGLDSYVVTHRNLPPAEGIRFVCESPCDLVRRLKKTQGKSIWICGGSRVIQPLLWENLIDVFHITVIPVLLGSGIRLFGELPEKIELRLMDTKSYDGITELIYTRRQKAVQDKESQFWE